MITKEEWKLAIVDDERHVLLMLEEMFTEHGFEVNSFERPEEFLETAVSEDYDTIILDFNMPGINGQDVVNRLIELDVLRATPVLLISGFLDDIIELPPREEGRYLAVEYMKKPAKLPWMLETVRNLAALRYWYMKAQGGS